MSLEQPEETAGTSVPGDGAEDGSGEGRAAARVDTTGRVDSAMDEAPETDATRRQPEARRPDLRAVEFSQVTDRVPHGETGSIEMLMDIRLPVSVELGRTESLVREILDYGPGTVVELDKLAGDPVDILVNGKLVAQGEVVVIDDHFGVRITVLLSPRERVRTLGE